MPVIQLFIGPFCIFLLFIFVLIYFDTKPTSDDSLRDDKKRELFRSWGIFLGTITVSSQQLGKLNQIFCSLINPPTALKLIFYCLIKVSIIVAAAASIMYYVVHLPGDVLFLYAKVLGYVASALVLLQWTPQIITTFRAKVSIDHIIWYKDNTGYSIITFMLIFKFD